MVPILYQSIMPNFSAFSSYKYLLNTLGRFGYLNKSRLDNELNDNIARGHKWLPALLP